MTKRLAIIPARGGSKRIKNKNIRDFCGRPMIAYVLETARDSKLFSAIHVSTESGEIQDTVKRLGFSVDSARPNDIADDHTPLMPVLRYVVDRYAQLNQPFDEVWLLMACSPLLKPSQLSEAAELFAYSGRARPLLAISEYPSPVE